MSDDRTYRAIRELREADDPHAPELHPHWVVLRETVQRYARRVGGGGFADRDETASESVIKLHRALPSIEANDEASTRAYIKKVVHRTYLDRVRERQRRRERFDGDYAQAEPGDSLLARIAAEPPADPRLHDPDALAPYEDALWNRIDAFVEARTRPHARLAARNRAHMAYERIVRRRSPEELHGASDREVKIGTLYQWVHRGREDVLIPVVEDWVAETGGEGEEGAFAAQLLAILRESMRRDAGEPRPGRRKKKNGD
ncbi:MAG: sigma factor [Myxococcota bacterium]